MSTCHALCDDLYTAQNAVNLCKEGCTWMHDNGGDVCTPQMVPPPPSPPPPFPPPAYEVCEATLTACIADGRNARVDNGCKAYAEGWAAGTYSCPLCGTVSQVRPHAISRTHLRAPAISVSHHLSCGLPRRPTTSRNLARPRATRRNLARPLVTSRDLARPRVAHRTTSAATSPPAMPCATSSTPPQRL